MAGDKSPNPDVKHADSKSKDFKHPDSKGIDAKGQDSTLKKPDLASDAKAAVCPLPAPPMADPCSTSTSGLVALSDAAALACIEQWSKAFSTGLLYEPFASSALGSYSGTLWFPAAQPAFMPDGAGDFYVTLIGIQGKSSELQTKTGSSYRANARVVLWAKFSHILGNMDNDSTVGLEHFQLDLQKGFTTLNPTSGGSCYQDCLSATNTKTDAGVLCTTGPPVSCTNKETHKAHFGALLDLEDPQKTGSSAVAALLADGSPCGHAPCSPYPSEFKALASVARKTWHILLVDYDPTGPTPRVMLCLDGKKLETLTLPSGLAKDLLTTSEKLPARVNAGTDKSGTESVELDWFALRGTP